MYTAVGNGVLEIIALTLCTIITKRLFMDFVAIVSLINGKLSFFKFKLKCQVFEMHIRLVCRNIENIHMIKYIRYWICDLTIIYATFQDITIVGSLGMGFCYKLQC